MKSFAGKVAAITGAASGMGRTLAVALARRNCEVAISDVDEVGLAETARLVDAARPGIRVTKKRLDVSDAEAMKAWAREVATEHGRVNLIFNNAGISYAATVEGAPQAEFDRIIDIDFWGVVHGTRAFLPFLRASGDGHVVNTSSNNGGFSPIAQSPTYAVCKAAVVTLSECLWGQLKDAGADHVGVSVLFPTGKTQGILDTGIWAPAERPPEFAPDEPIDTSNKMQMWIDMQEAAGTPVQFTPLSEVADTVVDGLYADRFWMVEEGRFEEAVQQRTDIILRRADPDYQR